MYNKVATQLPLLILSQVSFRRIFYESQTCNGRCFSQKTEFAPEFEKLVGVRMISLFKLEDPLMNLRETNVCLVVERCTALEAS